MRVGVHIRSTPVTNYSVCAHCGFRWFRFVSLLKCMYQLLDMGVPRATLSVGVTLLDSENINNFCLGRASLVSLVSICQRAQVYVSMYALVIATPTGLDELFRKSQVLLHIVNVI